jgi:arabinose-5-phosphate isomerase
VTRDLAVDALAVARATLQHTAGALTAMAGRLDGRFAQAVDVLAATGGKLVTSGVGKSGLVAQRLSATLTSTGTPSVFLHPTEAAHGDAGILQAGDCALFISKSGDSDELSALLEIVERLELPLIAITCRADSNLGRAARVVLETGDIAEPGPLDFVPTTSAAVFQTLGDALAMALVERRGFTTDDFAFLHPGGVLGRAMRLTAADLMHEGADLPAVEEAAPLRQVLVEILGKGLGITTVLDTQGRLCGVITDGDLKRIVLACQPGAEQAVWGLTAAEVMTAGARSCTPGTSVARAVRMMEEKPVGAITALVVTDPEGIPLGVLHIHDCLRAGVRNKSKTRR